MVRRLNARRWAAGLLVVVAAGALLWHVLACVESPMSFSPAGDLAFTTIEPYGGDDDTIALKGTHVYRLMVLPAGGDQPRVLETSSDWMISAPAFSPDGKRIAYLRVPLLTSEELSELVAAIDRRNETCAASTQPVEFTWPPFASEDTTASAPADSPPHDSAPWYDALPAEADRALPPVTWLRQFSTVLPGLPAVPGQLVEREAVSSEIVSVTDVILPVFPFKVGDQGEGVSHGLLMMYLLTRPQYDPEGRWVYFCPGTMDVGSPVWGVDTEAQQVRLVAGHALLGTLSFDGKTLATLHGGCLGFTRTDGSATTYVRWDKGVSPGGVTWADSETLALLGESQVEGEDGLCISFVKTDGMVTRTVELPKIEGAGHDDTGQLAISPDGKQMVVAFEEGVCFVDGNTTGQLTWKQKTEHEEEQGEMILAQPTFTPDGEQVAFKLMLKGAGEQHGRASAIVFLSLDGDQQRFVPIPPAKLPTTQPAEVDADANAPVIQPEQEKELEQHSPESP